MEARDGPAGAALAAARELAAAHGLPAVDALLLHAGSNVVVHLAPAPVVVRVMTGTAVLHADPATWLGRELAVCEELARLGAPVVAPSRELPPGPHHVGGLWLTGWEHIAVDRGAPAPGAAGLGRSLRELHAALARVEVELEPMAAVLDELAGLIDGLDDPRAEGWRAELGALPGRALGRTARAQAVHGDASLGNLLATTDGRRLWADFEDVRRGPVESDLAGLLMSARARGLGERWARDLRAAYGEADDDVLAAQVRLQRLYLEVWRAHHGPPPG